MNTSTSIWIPTLTCSTTSWTSPSAEPQWTRATSRVCVRRPRLPCPRSPPTPRQLETHRQLRACTPTCRSFRTFRCTLRWVGSKCLPRAWQRQPLLRRRRPPSQGRPRRARPARADATSHQSCRNRRLRLRWRALSTSTSTRDARPRSRRWQAPARSR